MNLGDQLDRLADDLDLPALPEPGVIVAAGDRRRARHRRRIVLAAAAAIAAVLALALNRVDHGVALQPAHDGGWRVTRTIAVPGSGVVVYAGGSLWVGDSRHETMAADGMSPAGVLYQVDPVSGSVAAPIPGVVGGWRSVSDGYLWMCTLMSDLNVLTRVDLGSHQVTRLATSEPRQPPHGTAYVAGRLWVANSDSGDLVALDPDTGRVLQTVHVGNPDMGETPILPVTDGSGLWFSTPSGEIWHFDGLTGKPISRLGVSTHQVNIVGVDTGRRTLYAVEAGGRTIFEVGMDQLGTWRGRKLTLSTIAGGIQTATATISNGALWVATANPAQLLMVDLQSFQIRERLPLGGVDEKSMVPVDLTSGRGVVWVRTHDKVLELTHPR
jgi:outer membrane protein assembly factor BamB